jgi:hypothetical protein
LPYVIACVSHFTPFVRIPTRLMGMGIIDRDTGQIKLRTASLRI